MNANRRSVPIFLFFLLFASTVGLTDLRAEVVVRGPYLQQGTSNSMIVRWRTDASTPSQINYGTVQGSLTLTAKNTTSTTEHELKLTGLQPDKVYFYSIIGNKGTSIAGGDSSHFFMTSPETGIPKATRIWVLGDSGSANSAAAAVRDAYMNFTGSRYTDLLVMLGDNAYESGTDSEYQKAVFNMYPKVLRQTPLWPTLGNHDARSADSPTQSGVYYNIFTLPKKAEVGGVASGTEAYFSFNYGNIHFINLDSMDTSRSKTGAMMTWLKNDLAANDQDWTIAFWHHPPYSKGSHNSDSETNLIQMRENALPILEGYGVDLVLTGHSHAYERSYLLDGHYGKSTTLTSGMILDKGMGRDGVDGPYYKTQLGPVPHDGAVYTVAGSSSEALGGSLNHPAMAVSLSTLGSVVLDIADNRLDAKFIDTSGKIKDYFSIEKGTDDIAPTIVSATAVSSTSVKVLFSEKVQATDANKASNYTIDQSVTVQSASLAADGLSVTLTTSALKAGITYTLKVSNIKDASGNAIVSGSSAKFTYSSATPSVSVWEGRVASGSNDSEETSSSGSIAMGSDDLELAYQGGRQTAATRFTSVGVPKGATVTKAYIQFQVDETGSSAVSMNIQGEYAGNSAALSTTAFDLSKRVRTVATVPWKPDAWTAVGDAGPAQRTTDIAPIIQEIVNGPNWTAGNALAVLFDNVSGNTGKRTAEAYNGSASGAPLLHIEYSTSSGSVPVNQAPAVTISAPASGATFAQGVSVTFSGSASDPEDGNITAKLAWVSDLDGAIGTGGSVSTTNLSAGTHQVTASVTDSNGLKSSKVVTVNVTSATTTKTWEGRVVNGADDAEETFSTRKVSLSSPDLEMAYVGGAQVAGVRFTNVAVPRGAKIAKAYLQFKAYETATTSVTLRIQGQNSGNALRFTTTTGDVSGRAKTSASVSWTPEAWKTVNEMGLPQRTPDLSPVVQAIVNRSDWASGNAMVLLVDNPTGASANRAAKSYNSDASGAPLLHIEYL